MVISPPLSIVMTAVCFTLAPPWGVGCWARAGLTTPEGKHIGPASRAITHVVTSRSRILTGVPPLKLGGGFAPFPLAPPRNRLRRQCRRSNSVHHLARDFLRQGPRQSSPSRRGHYASPVRRRQGSAGPARAPAGAVIHATVRSCR